MFLGIATPAPEARPTRTDEIALCARRFFGQGSDEWVMLR
jgi:hypothetical protein